MAAYVADAAAKGARGQRGHTPASEKLLDAIVQGHQSNFISTRFIF